MCVCSVYGANDHVMNIHYCYCTCMCIGVLKEGIRQGGTTSVLGSTFAMSVLSIFIVGEYREK